jgi:hypothetical protein
MAYEPKRRPPRVEENIPEFGDVRDVQRVFGLRESMTYSLWKEGKIKGVLVRAEGNVRGKRLFSYASIRKFLNSLEDMKDEEPENGSDE